MSISQEHLETPGETTFFAASNSSGGFVSYYGDIFGSGAGVDRLYVIKGGPGTGKSHFMRSVSRYAGEHGWNVITYRCSSDPASLDGVRLTSSTGRTVGLLDGTAPHAWELSQPGAREELIDLGAFWDGQALAEQADAISTLGTEKAEAYQRAYRYLDACGQADRVLDSLISPLTNSARLETLAARLLRGQGDGARTKRRQGRDHDSESHADHVVTAADRFPFLVPALRRAIGMTGRVRLDTFDRMAAQLICVGDHLGMGSRLLGCLLALSRTRGLRVWASYHPVNPDKVDGLFWPEEGLCVLADPASACTSDGCLPHVMSLRRCVDTEGVRRIRPAIREAILLRDKSSDAACHALSAAAQTHFALEKIYSATMNFSAQERMCDAFCKKVFGD